MHIRDVSTVVETRAELAASEARFRDLFEVATDAFGFVSVAGETPAFIDCNASLARVYGATDKGQVIGKTPLHFSPPLQPDGQPSLLRARMVCEQALRDGFARFDWFSRRLDGLEVWLDVTLTVQPSWGEGVLHFSGRDITDRKQAEQALARAEELARVTLQVRDQHALVKTGVYRLIRHPMYSSFFLLGLAQMLLLPNWLAGISGVMGAGILFAFRVLREERMMLESFGDEYCDYMTRTKRIVPWII